MKQFCLKCGRGMAHAIPESDNRPRWLCEACGYIHYENPRVIAGCIPVWEDRVLLCRRAIDPRSGLWTLPAGFLEQGETISAGAARETLEEACCVVHPSELYTVINVPHIHQIHMFYLADMASAEHAPGAESLETRLCTESEIPWDLLAFPTVIFTLKAFFEDRAAGNFRQRIHDILVPMRHPQGEMV